MSPIQTLRSIELPGLAVETSAPHAVEPAEHRLFSERPGVTDGSPDALSPMLETPIVVSAQVVVLTSCVLLGMGIIQKARVVVTGRAATEPILRISWLRPSWASTFLSVAALIEGGTLFLLLFDPPLGLLAFGMLLLAYGALLTRLPSDGLCSCLGEVLPMTNRQGILRNVVLAITAAMASSVAFNHDLSQHIVTQATAGFTVLLMAGLIGVAEILRVRSTLQKRSA
jgi:hypothetical protein